MLERVGWPSTCTVEASRRRTEFTERAWRETSGVSVTGVRQGREEMLFYTRQTNSRLAAADQLRIVHPRDGVISADYPLMLLAEARRADYDKLVQAFKAVAFQRDALPPAFLRPSNDCFIDRDSITHRSPTSRTR